ncbi:MULTISPECIES: helix-turn-helix domain-containing protein [Brevibacterium]|uniref:helix-turn-helix domain-containing protein n=1 Tax=Brevibacterium TaxID=1696 RepID=UPI0015F10EF6|nr:MULTISPECIES: helix-turn-helix domain-containing protein [Brevibacterium]
MSVSRDDVTFPADQAGYSQLREILRSDGPMTLSASDSRRANVPREVAQALDQALAVLERGDAVAISSKQQSLTTQQAAEILGVSRPTLIKYLDHGEIAYEMRGRHRRLALKDVLEFQEQRRVKRRHALDEMDHDAEDFRPARDLGFAETR